MPLDICIAVIINTDDLYDDRGSSHEFDRLIPIFNADITHAVAW